MFPFILLVGLFGVGAYLLKPQQLVQGPQRGSLQELAYNVLPRNFEAWVRTASPRQIAAVRRIAQYQLVTLSTLAEGGIPLPLPLDGRNTAAYRNALVQEVWKGRSTGGADGMTRDQFLAAMARDVSVGEPQTASLTSHANPDGSQTPVGYSLGASYMRFVDTKYRDLIGLGPGPSA